MGVLERWRGALDHTAGGVTYRELFAQDPPLLELSQRLFGAPPAELAAELRALPAGGVGVAPAEMPPPGELPVFSYRAGSH